MPSNKKPSKLESVSRALRTLGAGNRTLLRSSDEQELLREMCRVITEQGGYRLACVGYTQNDENRSIQWMECAGMDKEQLQALVPSLIASDGRTPFGTAIRTGKPSVARRVFTNPAFAAPAYARLMELAKAKGYASTAAFPLQLEGEILGAIVIAAADPEGFDDEELELLNELADDLAYGIANLRMQIKHRKAQEAIAHLAYHDSLTDLPNRTYLHKQLEEAIQLAKRQHHPLALLYFEVGQFHEINEILGHRSGDQLIQQLAQRLAEAAKPGEFLARIGEAAFALLLPITGADGAAREAQRFLEVLHEPVEISGLTIDAPVAAGIALFPGHGTDAEVLLRRANAAVDRAKPARGRYAFYRGQEQENARRLRLVGELQRAIERNELRLYCQPKVAIPSRQLSGAETLVRWEHPLHGSIDTGEFIKLAEQAALITPLTTWVLEAAFRQGYVWHEAGLHRPLSVNLSVHDLRDSRLIERIQGLFSTWGLPPELIQFEITESALMEDPKTGLDTLTRLKELGVELYIDDYGTGYSSLSYLQKLPVDWIKIDQSFVMPMVESGDSALIVRSTIELGHNLGLRVVAEGVESQALWDQLAAWGCDVAQGFFVGKPLPTDTFDDWETQWLRAQT
ncbi:diguanylate cyclase (GGDEF) domain-containing protein [Nitrosospira multiformis]|uniref:Diguanylate cyclase (GGDEF) domain-containing protein n=1 Tax=Nitrosospira multiformis TaxID=1231 RepID=A0A1H8MPT5_9PROT|nr:GGDEF domain-containing protein [Nitrosospira multiformis]SEO19347.1 diguanylate cyclase (GGDEF) domain-containing protein [Nitrosospira multiformis]